MYADFSLLFVGIENIETGTTLPTGDPQAATEDHHQGEDYHRGEETEAGLVLALPHHTVMETPGLA